MFSCSGSLRPGDWKYRELIFKTEITDFFIFCQEKPFAWSTIFENKTKTCPRVFDFEKSNKKKNCGFRAAAAMNSAENLDIFTSLSENDGLVYQNDLLHVCSVSTLQHRDVKILPRTAFSLRVIFGLYSFCNLKKP